MTRRPHPSIDFADEVSGRAAERDATRADGCKLLLTLAAVVAILGAFLGWHAFVAGLEPAAKRQDRLQGDRLENDRLQPDPLPAPYCRPTETT
jgi:hypothetical protein